MYDTTTMLLSKVPISTASADYYSVAWLDVEGYAIASVKARATSGGTAWSAGVLELVYDVFDGGSPQLFSTTKEITASAPTQTGIDVSGQGIRRLGVRVKTAEANVELDIIMHAVAANGTGAKTKQVDKKYSI